MPGAVGVNVHVGDVAPVIGWLFRYHWYVYGEVPPLTVDVKVTCWPTSIEAVVGLIETVGGVGAVLKKAFRT